MRGTGPVGWGGIFVYAYFTVSGGVTRVRVSLDEADRLGALEGLRVRLVLPGTEVTDSLIVRVRPEPPFAWIELTSLAPSSVNRAG
ncbi:MAG TPA: hypothetical protein VGE74_22260 [Gemmata sp.]